MILTEKEAKGKWCHKTFPNSQMGSGPFVCCASACMAWQWADGPEKELKDSYDITYRKIPWPSDERRGFCGLIVQPE